MKTLFALIAALFVSQVHAATLTSAHFDPSTQILSLQVVYEGGLKSHEFHLDWDTCQLVNGRSETAARLIDSGWDDTGTDEITQDLQFDMTFINCKPAELTIRADGHSHQTVWITP